MIKHSSFNAYSDNNGFIRLNISTNDTLSIDIAKDIIDAYQELSEKKPRCILIDLRNTKASVSVEAREYIGKDPTALKWRKAEAIITGSIITKLTANIFLKYSSPPIPIKPLGFLL